MTPDEATSPLATRFKDQFRDQPDNAQVTLRARGRVGQDGVCKVETCYPREEAGVHPLLGGDGTTACAADMLLDALVGCAGVTLSQMATAMEIELRNALIRAEGDLDFRGSLGLTENVPVGLKTVRLHLDVDSNATDEQLAVLVRLTERYCVVSRTLKPVTTVTFSAVTAPV